MTIPTVFLLTLLSSCILAQPANDDAKERSSRASHPGQIRYSDPDGSKVDWKLYAPENQWRSRLEGQRLERAEPGTSDAPKLQQRVSQPVYHEPQYQPFSAVPSHIKQLIVETYPHGGPYVDPGAFFYQAAVPVTVSSLEAEPKREDQVGHHSQTPQNLEREYFASAVNYRAPGYQADSQHFGQVGRVPLTGGIKYKNEERLSARSSPAPYVHQGQSHEQTGHQAQKQPEFARNSEIQYPRYERRELDGGKSYEHQDTSSRTDSESFDKGMPMAIKQLLTYQAQLPYHVIANQIFYRPKEIFVPKPLPDDVQHSKHYPSKIYFLKHDGQYYDNSEVANDENKSVKRY